MGDGLPIPLVDRKSEQEIADRKRELDIKEREVAAKEREVLAKEIELKRSRWINPTVIGLFAASLGLIGSVIVARVNNENTQAVQRAQSEATITLEAIKTGTGNTDDACKNLTFIVSLGLVRDPDGKIVKVCKDAEKGPPSLPAAAAPADTGGDVESAGTVLDATTSLPVEGARVITLWSPAKTYTDSSGNFRLESKRSVVFGPQFFLVVSKEGYERFADIVPSQPHIEIRLKREKR